MYLSLIRIVVITFDFRNSYEIIIVPKFSYVICYFDLNKKGHNSLLFRLVLHYENHVKIFLKYQILYCIWLALVHRMYSVIFFLSFFIKGELENNTCIMIY